MSNSLNLVIESVDFICEHNRKKSTRNFVSFGEAMPLTPAPPPNISKPNFDPDNPHWNFLSAFGIFALSVVLIVLFGVLAITAYTTYSGASVSSAEELMRDPAAIIANLIAIFPAHLFNNSSSLVARHTRRETAFFSNDRMELEPKFRFLGLFGHNNRRLYSKCRNHPCIW
jgi:hypothetical protein